MTTPSSNPAEDASKEALLKLYEAIDNKNSFIFEAGAGAGKTYSLVQALRYIIKKDGKTILKSHKRIACITYTNVAKDEIGNRIDKHLVVHTDTIHAFCWSLIKNFQEEIRKVLPTLGNWDKRIKEYHINTTVNQEGKFSDEELRIQKENIDFDFPSILQKKNIIYQLGHPSIKEYHISLHHDDVINTIVELLKKDKFRRFVVAKYPIILIDEYQDTSSPFITALEEHFITPETDLQLGFFGDHWQKIYNDGCGEIKNTNLIFIPKNANFRSSSNIVAILNKMRPELPQEPKDTNSIGVTSVFHTNSWGGTRRAGGHWAGDLPAEDANKYLDEVIQKLENDGWDFNPEKTKILMLTHNVLAEKQGYKQLADVFSSNEAYIKKEDKHISYFADFIEPICEAYEAKKYGEMFSIIGKGSNGINSHTDKEEWKQIMAGLIERRENKNIGDVIDFLLGQSKIHIPETIKTTELNFKSYNASESEEEPSTISRIRALREVPYKEITSVTKFINDHTPFATNHSIKGEEYENVLIVIGRGWNLYNFDQMLKWYNTGIPTGKEATFERSRNLFYVACSRPKRNLVLLFTQKLSDESLKVLSSWFGTNNIIPLH